MSGTFVGGFEEQVAAFGPRRLYTWVNAKGKEEDTLTYSELRARAIAVCIAIRRAKKLEPGSRVMAVYPPGLEFLVAFFGCQYAAVTVVPYYPPVIITSARPTAGALRVFAEGLTKLKRIVASCAPSL